MIQFTKKQKKEMLCKIMPGIGQLLTSASTKYTDREISEITKVPPTRLTEYKNFEKYGNIITENHLASMLGGGIFSMDDLLRVAGGVLSEAEQAELARFKFYEDVPLRQAMVEAHRKGIDPTELVRWANTLMENGIDPIEVLKNKKG